MLGSAGFPDALRWPGASERNHAIRLVGRWICHAVTRKIHRVKEVPMEKFSQNLKMLRKVAKVQQKEISQALGINVRTYQAYEYGDNEPGLQILIGIADFYHITLDELVGRVTGEK
jgi:DNA-binding XRE family transcriptional regulator